MADSTYTINNLRELSLPEAPLWWPLAPGLSFLLVLLAWIGLCLGFRFYQKYNSRAYRRAGLALLSEARTAHELSVVLKRVALAAYEREQVASLYGGEWISFLEKSCLGVQLSALSSEDNVSAALREQASIWIRNHREC
jgi:hypothetical protein